MAKTATIVNAKICDAQDLWRKKLPQLKFGDTDVIVVTLKAGNEKITDTFVTCIKPNGTFALDTPNKVSRARRKRLADFLTHYLKVEDPESYNLKEKINEWKGKRVEVVESNKRFHIVS